MADNIPPNSPDSQAPDFGGIEQDLVRQEQERIREADEERIREEERALAAQAGSDPVASSKRKRGDKNTSDKEKN